jgi:polyhydroxyalkanoate synthesis regulator phasin
MNNQEKCKIEKVQCEISKLVDELFKLTKLKFENTTELERQVIATFCFGVINAMAVTEKLSQPQVQALTIAMLVGKFRYSNQQAIDFSQELINATKKEYHPVMNQIIHRGIDGHYQYVNNQKNQLRDNLINVINIVNGKE